MSTTEFIGTSDTARLLNMSRSGLIKAATEGRVPTAGRIGKRQAFVFQRSEIEALAKEKRVAPEAARNV